MPEGVTPPPPKPEGYMQQAGKAMAELLQARGLSTERPAFKPDTRLAHIGTKYAANQVKQFAFVQQVFHHHWALNQDISQPDVLARAASSAGLDAEAFTAAIHDPHWIEAVEKDYELIKQMEITTIPAYVGSNGVIQVHHFKDMPTLEQIRAIL